MKLFNRTLTAAVLVAATATIIVAGGKNKGNNKNNTITNTPTEAVATEAMRKAEFKAKWEEAEREKREAEEMLAPWTQKENLSPIIRSGSGSASAQKADKKSATVSKSVTTAPANDLKEKEAESAIKDRSFLTSTQHRLEIVNEDAPVFEKKADETKAIEFVKSEEAEAAPEKAKNSEEKVYSSSADAERANDERRKALILAYEQGAELSAADLEFLRDDAKLMKRAERLESIIKEQKFEEAEPIVSEDSFAPAELDISTVSDYEIKNALQKGKRGEILTDREKQIFEHTYVPRMPNKTLRANR